LVNNSKIQVEILRVTAIIQPIFISSFGVIYIQLMKIVHLW